LPRPDARTTLPPMTPTPPAQDTRPVPAHRLRRRSVGFIERDGQRWACFLVSFPDGDGRWRGFFAFRPSGGHADQAELRTADIFVEESESAIHQKAWGLGRPLLGGLLDSASHVQAREHDDSPFLRRWFRRFLAEHSLLLADSAGPPPDLDELRSLYASYRLDQVAHLIALVDPADFEEAVAAVLEGQGIDFAAKDRLQLAMLVVSFIEERLPLPPFEVWAADYLANRSRYQAYAHTLHREGRLP
jgi:hypothetical protein